MINRNSNPNNSNNFPLENFIDRPSNTYYSTTYNNSYNSPYNNAYNNTLPYQYTNRDDAYYRVPANRALRNKHDRGRTLEYPNFSTHNKETYPNWWPNEDEQNDSFAEEQSEKEHHPGDLYEIANKDLINKRKNIIDKIDRFDEEKIFNYQMRKLKKNNEENEEKKVNDEDKEQIFSNVKTNMDYKMNFKDVNDNMYLKNNLKSINNNLNSSNKPLGTTNYKMEYDRNFNVTSMEKKEKGGESGKGKVSFQLGKTVRMDKGITKKPSQMTMRMSRVNTPSEKNVTESKGVFSSFMPGS